MSESATILRFDVFELDTAAGEMRRQGERLKLPPQPSPNSCRARKVKELDLLESQDPRGMNGLLDEG